MNGVNKPEVKLALKKPSIRFKDIKATKKPKPIVVRYSTNCAMVSNALQLIGVHGSELSAAVTNIQRESGCNINAINPTSGACSLVQALPCSKIAGVRYSVIGQMRWYKSYVYGRYGSFAAALRHSYAKGWY